MKKTILEIEEDLKKEEQFQFLFEHYTPQQQAMIFMRVFIPDCRLRWEKSQFICRHKGRTFRGDLKEVIFRHVHRELYGLSTMAYPPPGSVLRAGEEVDSLSGTEQKRGIGLA